VRQEVASLGEGGVPAVPEMDLNFTLSIFSLENQLMEPTGTACEIFELLLRKPAVFKATTTPTVTDQPLNVT